MRNPKRMQRNATLIASAISVAYLGAALFFIDRSFGLGNLGQLQVFEAGAVMAGLFVPILFIWCVAFFISQTNSVSDSVEELLGRLDELTYPPDAAVEKVQAITNSLRQQAFYLRQTSDELVEQLDNARRGFESQSKELVGLSSQAAEQAVSLGDALKEQKDEITEAHDLVREQLAATRSATEEQVDALEQAAQKARDAAEEISSTLSGPIGKFSEAAERAMTETSDAGKLLNRYGGEIILSTERVKEAAKSLRNELEGDAKAVFVAASNLTKESKRFTQDVQEQLGQLTSAFELTVNQADYLKATVAGQREDVEKRNSEIGEKADADNSSLQAAAQEVRSAFDFSQGRAKELGTEFEEKALLLGQSTDEATARMRDAVDKANEELTAMGQAAVESYSELANHASRKLHEAGERVRPHVQALTAASERAVERAAQAGNVFKSQAGELNKAAETAGKQIENLGEKLVELSAQISESARQAGERNKDFAASFETHNRALLEASAAAQKASSALRTAVREEVERAAGLTRDLQRLANESHAVANEQTVSLQQASEQARLSGEEFRERVVGQVGALLEASDKSLHRLTDMGEMLEHRSIQMNQVIDAVLGKSRDLDKVLAAQSGTFRETVDSIADSLSQVGTQFIAQTDALRRASDEASKQAVSLRNSDLESRRDLFLRTATVMIEDLNSTAIDLNKMLEVELPEELWKQYRKGDRSVFARWLSRPRENGFKVTEISKRYEHDERFRNQVTRYINQFESLLSQAANCDPEHVLSSTFMTADVGKLYYLLSRSISEPQ